MLSNAGQVRVEVGLVDPIGHLRRTTWVKAEMEARREAAVVSALRSRHSFEEIGLAAGVSRQTAHARWSAVQRCQEQLGQQDALAAVRAAIRGGASPEEQLEAVSTARAARHSWSDIATAGGLSRKSAHARWGSMAKGRAGRDHLRVADETLEELRIATLELDSAAAAHARAARAARAAGLSWAEIGRATGLTRQVAYNRWR